jgi:hypothetical protein
MEKIIIQITAGRGPVECCRVVWKTQMGMKQWLMHYLLKNNK